MLREVGWAGTLGWLGAWCGVGQRKMGSLPCVFIVGNRAGELPLAVRRVFYVVCL